MRWCVTVDYQQIANDNISNQIHGFAIDYGKCILSVFIVIYSFSMSPPGAERVYHASDTAWTPIFRQRNQDNWQMIGLWFRQMTIDQSQLILIVHRPLTSSCRRKAVLWFQSFRNSESDNTNKNVAGTEPYLSAKRVSRKTKKSVLCHRFATELV